MKISRSSLIILILSLAISIFFRVKIIEELPLGTSKTEYGLIGFDDEPAHLNYVKYLTQYDDYPVLKRNISDPNAFEHNEFEYHQPPVYYEFVSNIVDTFGLTKSQILKVGRYFNLILYLVSIPVIALIFIKFGFGGDKLIAMVITFLLLGSTIYFSSLLSNDMLSWLLIWSIILFSISDMRRTYVYLIVLISLAHLTKFNVILVYPFLIYLLIKKRRDLQLFKGVLIIILPIIISLPWYFRNYEIYGNPLILGNITGESWYYVSNFSESLIRLKQTIFTFFFGMYFEPTNNLISVFNLVYYLWALFSVIYLVINIKNIIKKDTRKLIFICTNLIGFLYFAIPTGFTEARQLFPSLPFLIMYLISCLDLFISKLKLSRKFLPIFCFVIFTAPILIGFYL